MVGRFIGVISCIIGVFLLSLLTVSSILFITLENEDEIKVRFF